MIQKINVMIPAIVSVEIGNNVDEDDREDFAIELFQADPMDYVIESAYLDGVSPNPRDAVVSI